MPGIAGIIGKGLRGKDTRALDLMIECMLHSPSCKSGTQVNDRLDLWSGWVCQEGAFSDCLPVWNERRDIFLIFSGEDFTERGEIEQLKARGHHFAPENAGYLVHSYEEFGMAFLEKLNGGFCGLLADLREEKIVLFNDRYGLNRIYFHENETGFYFSSEAKSLLKVLPELRRLDLRSLGEFFSCGCVLQNRTLFSGISLLPAGSAWTFAPARSPKKQAYFSAEIWEKQEPMPGPQYYEKLKQTWSRILPRYFRGEDRVALSLTGGVDSRMILAWAPCPPGTLLCYTFGGTYRDCADVKISRKAASICGQPHETIPVGREFLSRFPSLAEKTVYLSDGTMDVTGSIDLYVQEIARRMAPVRVTGTNGGETLRSLVAFKPSSLCPNLLEPELARHIYAASATYAEELQGHKLSFTAFKQAPWYMGSKFVLERSQLTLRMPYFDNELVRLAYQAPPEAVRNNDVSLRLIADGNPALGRIGTDRGRTLRALPGVARTRRLFQEFTYRAEYAFDYGMPQWLAKVDHALASLHLERLFLGRHKFHHFRVYYRDELSHYLKDILLDSRTRSRPYVRGACLPEIVKGHLRGNRNYTLEIHKLLTLELIQRQLIEQN